MVALRKDVKVGFVVGALALAVVGVYTGLSALAGKPASPAAGDASKLVETARVDEPRAVADTPAPTANKAPAVPAAANPTTPVAARPAGSDDVWSNAFSNGAVQPAVTVTPSLPNTSREPAAKPADVIRALNDPASARPSQQQSASTTDPSGSLAAGTVTPTLTRTPAATRPTAAELAIGATTHTVKPGENFSSIAAEHYGDANLYRVLLAANPTVDAGKLKPGMTLQIPAREKATARRAPAAASEAAPANVDPVRQYVVKPGDSLEGIASALYGERSKWQAIYDANKSAIGDSPAKLKVGTVLSLPTPPTKK